MKTFLKSVLMGSGPVVLLTAAWAADQSGMPGAAPGSTVPGTQGAASAPSSQPAATQTQPATLPVRGGGRGTRG